MYQTDASHECSRSETHTHCRSLITFKLRIYKVFLLVFIYIHIRKSVCTYMQTLKAAFQNDNEATSGELTNMHSLVLYFLK